MTAREIRVEQVEQAADGAAYMVRGSLGVVAGPLEELGDVELALAPVWPSVADRIAVPVDQLIPRTMARDELGMVQIRYRQEADGLPVVGAVVIVHVDRDGLVRSITSTARNVRGISSIPVVSASVAAQTARESTPDAEDVAGPELVYVIGRDNHVYLSWRLDVRGAALHDSVFVDAATGEVVARHPNFQPVLNRAVYLGGDLDDDNFNPPQVGSEGAPPSDPIAKLAYDNSGITYNCFKELFNRDSWDNTGGQLISYARVTLGGEGLNNAFWSGSAMYYGDGDGVLFRELARSLDVAAHELAHGVTQATGGLVYQLESGALNEATSDILGATCEAFHVGAVNAETWLIGDEIFTPAVAGDAIRYMHNPTQDNNGGFGSTDYYPERLQLPPGQEPGSNNDNGYVHLNSGIANLAFYLLVQGGTHPRNKTPFLVPTLGINKAARIWYRALSNYFTPNQTFEQARTATEMAAADLFPGGQERNVIGIAWAAVGVGAPVVDTTPPTVTITSPTAGATVESGFVITATATDDQAVARVDFTVNGQVVGSSTTAPYSVTTTALGPGTHDISVTAFDALNQGSAAATVKIIDPTCGSSCTGDQTCEMTTGQCVDAPADSDTGGCCTTSRRGPGVSILWLSALALLLRRRRPRP